MSHTRVRPVRRLHLVAGILIQIRVGRNLNMGNREQLTGRISRRLMIPPPSIGESSKSDQVGSSLTLENKLPSSFCQQLVQCQRTGSVSFGGPVGIAEVSAFTFIDQRSEERRVGRECRSRWTRDH